MWFGHLHSTKEVPYGLFILHVQLDSTIGHIKSLYGLDKYSETIKNLEFANKIAKDKTHVDFAMPAAELLKSASNEYSKILESSNIGRSLSEQLKNSLAELHIDTLTKLALSNSSKMINEISEYYVNMNYEAIIKTINTSLCESRLSDVNDNMPREYLIPCFVSDCCKRIGFEGIKYHGSETYKNYVLWEDGYFEYKGMC